MSSKLEPVIWLRDTGHIGIHGGVDGRTVMRSYGRTANHIFLTMVLCARGAPL